MAAGGGGACIPTCGCRRDSAGLGTPSLPVRQVDRQAGGPPAHAAGFERAQWVRTRRVGSERPSSRTEFMTSTGGDPMNERLAIATAGGRDRGGGDQPAGVLRAAVSG